MGNIESNPEPTIWALNDERPGTGNQVLGVAEALDMEFQIKDLSYTVGSKLPFLLTGPSLVGITRSAKTRIIPPWPDLVVSAGRRAATAACHIKQKAAKSISICQIMYPGSIVASNIDLIAVPEHDNIRGENIVSIDGAPNRISDAFLKKSSANWHGVFDKLARPIIGVAIGGSTRRMPLNSKDIQELAALISKRLKSSNGSLAVTTSRRSGALGESLLTNLRHLNCEPHLFYPWGEGSENPYWGILAHADAIIVTADSVSMISEACASEGNVYIFGSKRFSSPKHLRFIKNLYEMGAARPLKDYLEGWQSTRFNAANKLASYIKTYLGWQL